MAATSLGADWRRLSSFEGETYVSLVGFRFLDRRILGVAVPLDVSRARVTR